MRTKDILGICCAPSGGSSGIQGNQSGLEGQRHSREAVDEVGGGGLGRIRALELKLLEQPGQVEKDLGPGQAFTWKNDQDNESVCLEPCIREVLN